MGDMTYEVVNNRENQQFEVHLNGEIAQLTYRYYKKDIAFMHTTVPETMAGKGVASALARAAFAFAAEEKKLVMVYCPFVAKFLQSHPEYRHQLDRAYYGKS
ncbi:GNAT family N-acetyltransferase [Chitinophaga sp. GCM10012297]|uniref:N-acetyltransferase n=1 Tax=Chitinophaga chungangae TaxID=2821488 RepID=A0ABS3YC38_9BACT|nr:N-acetyltransferase [Chitinophaga chungangae]MBO9152240.1 N-acetyltransferase [Chitinophaga chungangae]